MAIKSVYAEFTDENGNVTKMPVYKDPKTDREAGGGNFKKSQKGCVKVFAGKYNGDYHFFDGYTWDETLDPGGNELRTIFKDGKMVIDDDLNTIRQRLNNCKF
jgi:hypothetical protein